MLQGDFLCNFLDSIIKFYNAVCYNSNSSISFVVACQFVSSEILHTRVQN